MTPFTPTPEATNSPDQLMLSVTWYSGVESLDMLEIETALNAYTPGAKVQTTELRDKELCEVAYEPTIAPALPDGFTLTYTDGGIWLDDTDNFTPAHGDKGTATYQRSKDKDGKTIWECTWQGKDKRTDPSTPTCVLSNEINARKFREHKVAVRDYKFRALILQDEPTCLITGETDKRILDAAHIHEVRHGGKDLAKNGIVLRTDLHKLFDKNILTINSDGVFTINPMLESYKEWFKEPKFIDQKKLEHYLENINARNIEIDNRNKNKKSNKQK